MSIREQEITVNPEEETDPAIGTLQMDSEGNWMIASTVGSDYDVTIHDDDPVTTVNSTAILHNHTDINSTAMSDSGKQDERSVIFVDESIHELTESSVLSLHTTSDPITKLPTSFSTQNQIPDAKGRNHQQAADYAIRPQPYGCGSDPDDRFFAYSSASSSEDRLAVSTDADSDSDQTDTNVSRKPKLSH